METRANFALIGAFTVAIVFAAFGFVYWFSGPSLTAQYKSYEIVFSGSVAGLSRGSAVQFNGLKVGEVTNLSIPEDDPSRVHALAQIAKTTPVKADTKARIEQSSLAGIPVVSLTGGTPDAPEPPIPRGQGYPRIEAERSQIQNLLENLQRFAVKASDAFEKVDRLIDANADSLQAAAKNLETLSKTLADNSKNIDKLLGGAADASARLDRLLAALDPKKVSAITNDLAGASANINRFSGTALRQYEQLAIDARKALDTLERATRSLEKNPQQLLFGPSAAIPNYQSR